MASATTSLAGALERLANEQGDEETVVRCELQVPDVDPLVWLAAQRGEERLYWEDRDSALSMAGVGFASSEECDDLASLKCLTGDDDSRGPHVLFAGRFDPERAPSEEWARFGRMRGYLPAIELSRKDATTWLACNVILDGGDEPIEKLTRALRELRPPIESEPPACSANGSAGTMDDAWSHGVERVLDRIRDGDLEKAVLARRATYRAEPDLDPVQVLRALSRDHPHTFLFCLQLAPDLAFIGASPELLYRRKDRTIESDALAGTRRRGETEAEDRSLADELVTSAKDRREHELVRAHIAKQLAPLCRQLVSPPTPWLRQLTNVQHLCSDFRGGLEAGVDDTRVLAQLHPTPAVCGLPTQRARAEIDACEGFDRGLYGGPIGCVGPDGVQCAVAIRSGLLCGREFFAFAGAGIVAGSAAATEWDETVNKMQAFSDLLGAPA